MAQQYPELIWQNGRIKPWAEATVHVMAHALHYGSSVFEGIRSYDTPNGPAIFRLTDHNKRLLHSAKIYDMAIPYSLEEINAACRDVVKANGLGAAYLRPVAFRGLGGFGLSAETPIDMAVARRGAMLHVPDPRPIRDSFIAATALVHGMTVVTRNVADFASTGVALVNPWDHAS